ncbi:hypothetical protein ACFTSF_11210 [Kribbella sp. NPDC056951]|uniref:hypothetical protein n=1 Tax=Kribbella sp. NPDC056951 TaxID=3345978 RepID=UPI003635E5D2
MPVGLWIVAGVLVLLGLTFCVIPVAAYRYGDAAQRAAEADVRRQGAAVELLEQHRVQFSESGREMLFPFGIAAVLFVLAALDLAGIGVARVLTWILAGLLLTGGGFVTGAQLLADRYVAAAFRRSSDPAARGLDASAVVRAAGNEFPSWLRPLQFVRFVLATAGSIVVIVLLATSAVAAHFRS